MGMVDCVGNELKIGDKVVCADYKYADLLIGEVIGFSPKKARVRYNRSDHAPQYTHEKLRESWQIFKYEEVVRCKDCIYYIETVGKDSGKPCGYGSCGCVCQIITGIIYDDDFCSYGERKANETV